MIKRVCHHSNEQLEKYNECHHMVYPKYDVPYGPCQAMADCSTTGVLKI